MRLLLSLTHAPSRRSLSRPAFLTKSGSNGKSPLSGQAGHGQGASAAHRVGIMDFVLVAALILTSPFPSLPYVDEGRSSAQFSEFRVNIVNSIKRRKYGWVIARIAPEIKFSFGAEGGIADLRKTWAEFPESKEQFFADLLECLSLGGQFKTYGESRYFVAPYVFSSWPDGFDAFEHYALIADDVPVFPDANRDSAPTTRLTRTIVRHLGKDELGLSCVKFGTEDDEIGWVPTDAIRSPIDVRAVFAIGPDGSYRLETLVAGD
jgi:hypothetical protein